MARRFNKEIKTEEQKAIFNQLLECKENIKNAENILDDKWNEYSKIEGKYAKGKKQYAYYDAHFRDWYYVYANQEDKQKEELEAKEYYQNIIEPQKTEIECLKSEYRKIENELCKALWGYGVDEYYAIKQREADLKELAELEARVTELKAKLGIN